MWFLVSVAKKRGDLADVAWGTGFVLVAWTSQFLSTVTVYGLIINILVTIWAIRLTLHIYLRNRNREEDFRYQALKKQWGKNVKLKLFSQVFLLQGFILYIVALPVMWVHTHPQHVSFQALGIAMYIWACGFCIEALADYQLAIFQKDPSKKGQLLTTGLWGYVRHPNYLGELLQWWAIWIMVLPFSLGWTLIISPLLITFIIVKVSGIKPLEEKMHKHPDFQEYAAKTPSLVPPSLVNGSLYWAAWYILIVYGASSSSFVVFGIVAGCYALQVFLFAKWDPKSLRLFLPLSIFATIWGVLQEWAFIHFGILSYGDQVVFPPLWLIALYPLFSLTLNSALSFVNKNLMITFFLGGIGGVLSYVAGEGLGEVRFLRPLAYPVVFLSWGVFLVAIVVFNRKLLQQMKNL